MNKVHDITESEWEECKKYFNNECAYCGLSEEKHKEIYNQQLHKEHVDPSGSNKIDNCIPSCKSCNSSKGDLSMEDWYCNENNSVFNQERLNRIYKWLNNFLASNK